jgi:hypothetical protein
MVAQDRGDGEVSPAARACAIVSSVLTPKPGTCRTRSSATAARSESSDATPSVSNSLRAFFGPSPGIRVISTSPGGYFALSLTALGICPVSSSASIFSAIVLPTPDKVVTLPCRASSSTDTGASRIAFAAFRYATTR